MHYRIAYQSNSEVNWCEALEQCWLMTKSKTASQSVAANPVEAPARCASGFLRITEYAIGALRAGSSTRLMHEDMQAQLDSVE